MASVNLSTGCISVNCNQNGYVTLNVNVSRGFVAERSTVHLSPIEADALREEIRKVMAEENARLARVARKGNWP